jgi:uncharacterized membrane protein
MEPRTVAIGRGWGWFAGGLRLFLRSPLMWTALLLILFVAMNALKFVPILALVAILLMPIFIAGLMEGCKAVEEGRKLELAHLTVGFRKNAAQLVTIGGVSLVGNLLVAMIVFAMGGEAITTMVKTMSKAPMTPQVAEQMQAAMLIVSRALLLGAAVSLPLLMALWYAPLLIYFNDVRPVEAMRLSFVACMKNVMPMLFYGAIILAGLMVLVPAGIKIGLYELGLWLMAPALVPSIYVSYKDIFVAADPTPAGDGNPFLR